MKLIKSSFEILEQNDLFQHVKKYGKCINDKSLRAIFFSLIHKKLFLEARLIIKELLIIDPDNKDLQELLILLNIRIEKNDY